MENCMKNCIYGTQRFLVTVVVVAIAYFVMDMFFHHIVLGSLYQENLSFWRAMPDMMAKRCVAYAGYILFAFFFVCIFSKGFEKEKCRQTQGLKFGLLIGLLYWGTALLICYPFFPWPDKLYLAWFGIGMVECVILGFISGLMVKKQI